MTQPLNPHMAATFPPPVMEARRWLAGVSFPPERPLINISQAAPVDLPPLALRQAIAEAAVNNPEAHLYNGWAVPQILPKPGNQSRATARPARDS